MNNPFTTNKPPPPSQSAAMDDAISQVLEACKLSRELESDLPHIANDPSVLFAACEQVSSAFNKALCDLRSFLAPTAYSFDQAGHLIVGEDWTHHLHGSDSMPTGPMAFSQLGLEAQATAVIAQREFVAAVGGVSFAGGEREHAVAGTVAGGILGGASTGQRTSRRRRDSGDTRTERIPALRTGNLALPPDDGYTWRKYGQKTILGSKFPRSYFRCTHKNFYGCQAKKKVQMLDSDPNVCEIIYCGNHTCQTSPTPLLLPSITPTTNENSLASIAEMTRASQSTPASLSTSIELSSWFLRRNEAERKLSYSPFISSHEVGESSRASVGPSEPPPPLPMRTAREGEGSVADLADVMFNSGSSSNNSMDTIFTFKTD